MGVGANLKCSFGLVGQNLTMNHKTIPPQSKLQTRRFVYNSLHTIHRSTRSVGLCLGLLDGDPFTHALYKLSSRDLNKISTNSDHLTSLNSLFPFGSTHWSTLKGKIRPSSTIKLLREHLPGPLLFYTLHRPYLHRYKTNS